MADNTELDAGSGGDTIHTDELTAGTYKMPTSKIIFGTSGNNDGYWAAGAGAVGSTTGRVTLASDDPAVALLGTIDADTGTIAGAVSGTEMQVDVVAALPAGTNAIGKLAANSGVDIGDVDVLTIANMHSADYDTGAGTDTTLAIGIAVPASGGAAVIPGDATAGLKVDLGADNDVTVTGSVTANAGTNLNTSALALESGGNLASAVTALQIIDDWDESDRAKVNPIAGQAGVAAGAGAVGATTQRVTLASDDPGVALLTTIDADTGSLAGCVGGTEIQVDVVGALPAGTNAIGKLAANSGVDIGDVDILSIAAGTNLIGGMFLSASTSATGTTTFYDNDLDETKIEVTDNPTVRIYSIVAFNTTAAPLFLQLFDLDADSVTVGTTAPTNQYVIPGNGDSDGAGFVINFPVPKAYSTGFTVACTTDSQGSSAPSTGACIVNIEYASAA